MSHREGLQVGGRARSPLRAAAFCVHSGLRRAEDCAPCYQQTNCRLSQPLIGKQ